VKHLDIAEVARQSGVPASTLRFYEEKGLIASTGRRGLRRLFEPGVLERLALIALGRAAGFSLEEIALMFAPEGQPCIDRQMLVAKARPSPPSPHPRPTRRGPRLSYALNGALHAGADGGHHEPG